MGIQDRGELRASCRGSRGAQRGEIGVGVVGAAGQRRGGDQQEPLGAGQRGVVGEFLGRDEAIDRGVLHRRLQVLADGEEIDVGDAQVVHHLGDFGPGFAEADHQAGLGEDRRDPLLHAVEQAQRLVVARAGTDGGIQPRHGFQVVVEHVGPGVGDGLDGAGLAQEVGGQHLDRGARGGGADGADDGGEVRRRRRRAGRRGPPR